MRGHPNGRSSWGAWGCEVPWYSLMSGGAGDALGFPMSEGPRSRSAHNDFTTSLWGTRQTGFVPRSTDPEISSSLASSDPSPLFRVAVGIGGVSRDALLGHRPPPTAPTNKAIGGRRGHRAWGMVGGITGEPRREVAVGAAGFRWAISPLPSPSPSPRRWRSNRGPGGSVALRKGRRRRLPPPPPRPRVGSEEGGGAPYAGCPDAG